MAASISFNPIASDRKLVRKQVFTIFSRGGFSMVIFQSIGILRQMHESKFTGQVVFNFGNGSINSATAVDSQSIDD